MDRDLRVIILPRYLGGLFTNGFVTKGGALVIDANDSNVFSHHLKPLFGTQLFRRKANGFEGDSKVVTLCRPEAPIVCKYYGLSSRPNAKLVKEIGHVIANGLFADRQSLSYFCVAQTLGDK